MILVIAAMKSEVDAILAFYPFKKISEHLFRYVYHTKEIYLTVSGVGKVAAAHRLSSIIATYQVDKIYNLGVAGATKPYQQGDTVLIESAMYHDFDLTMFDYEKGQVPGCPPQFKSSPELIDKASSQMVLKKANLLTGDCFMTNQLPGSYAVDMEGAALYHVAFLEDKPIVSVKVISDIMGMESHLESYQAFEASKGAELLLKVFQKIIVEG